MRIEDKEQRSLDRYEFKRGGGDASLAEAADLLYDLLNGSYRCSGTCLDAEYNGQRMNVQSLYWACKELLDRVSGNYERTGFLAMSVLEQAYDRAKPLLLCSLSDLVSGDASMPEKAARLEGIFKENPYKRIWAEKSVLYASILEKAGFKADPEMFSDLTAVMDPLLNALSFYGGDPKKAPKFSRVRTGEPSRNGGAPMISGAISLYRSKKELADAVMSSPYDRLLAFGAVEQSNAQVKDYFYEWRYGYPDERQRNMMKNDGLTAEEYLSGACEYTRAVYLCVKDGGSCYLVYLPWNGNGYGYGIGNPEYAYYYGKRASYAPYQAFYAGNVPPAPEGSFMLSVPRSGWLLSDLMDPMAMAWYPAFLDETMRVFFKERSFVFEDLVFAEETAAEFPSGGTGEYAVVPAFSGVPAVCSWTYRIKGPEEVFEEEWLLDLFSYFKVTEECVRDVPILSEKDGTADELGKTADDRLKAAYVKILAERIADFMEGRWDARKWMLGRMDNGAERIIRMAGDGTFSDFASIVVDGTPVLDADGNPRMTSRDRYPYDKVVLVEKTDPEDGRETKGDLKKCFGHRVFWASAPTSGRPPAVLRIRPKNGEQYALVAGCPVSELPEILKLSGPLSKFYEEYRHGLPSSLTNEWTARGYGDPEKKSIFVPCFGALNICMTKKAYKSFFKKNKKLEGKDHGKAKKEKEREHV